MDLKRIFDVTLAATGIVMTAPVALAACFAMAITNRSFPIYTQTRLGLNKEPFNIYKIKSMKDTVDESGKPLPDDERTTLLGKAIRKIRIDEIPQFVNILKGEMSSVGPRAVPLHSPLSMDEKRHQVKPGLTGFAQIAGKNNFTAQQILEMDHLYVDTQSLLVDLKTCALTPVTGLLANLKAPHNRKDAQVSSAPEPDIG